jgi:adenosyl cobinamide kinase/adenosyl cobinamide phosphate guanylyltransferase
VYTQEETTTNKELLSKSIMYQMTAATLRINTHIIHVDDKVGFGVVPPKTMQLK